MPAPSGLPSSELGTGTSSVECALRVRSRDPPQNHRRIPCRSHRPRHHSRYRLSEGRKWLAASGELVRPGIAPSNADVLTSSLSGSRPDALYAGSDLDRRGLPCFETHRSAGHLAVVGSDLFVSLSMGECGFTGASTLPTSVVGIASIIYGRLHLHRRPRLRRRRERPPKLPTRGLIRRSESPRQGTLLAGRRMPP